MFAEQLIGLGPRESPHLDGIEPEARRALAAPGDMVAVAGVVPVKVLVGEEVPRAVIPQADVIKIVHRDVTGTGARDRLVEISLDEVGDIVAQSVLIDPMCGGSGEVEVVQPVIIFVGATKTDGDEQDQRSE